MIDGVFNDVASWNFHEFPRVFNCGQGFLIKTEKELVEAYEKAKAFRGVSILEVILEPTIFLSNFKSCARICWQKAGNVMVLWVWFMVKI